MGFKNRTNDLDRISRSCQPRPGFFDSPYFVEEPFNWHLKDDAPEELKKEFQEYMRGGERSMFYIPKDWIEDKKNESKIHEILNEHLYTDINLNSDLAIQELKDIGETTLIEKLKDGTLKID